MGCVVTKVESFVPVAIYKAQFRCTFTEMGSRTYIANTFTTDRWVVSKISRVEREVEEFGIYSSIFTGCSPSDSALCVSYTRSSLFSVSHYSKEERQHRPERGLSLDFVTFDVWSDNEDIPLLKLIRNTCNTRINQSLVVYSGGCPRESPSVRMKWQQQQQQQQWNLL
ncbi:hypothetical protein WN51_04262 [Melipona quadrifasciata]|uniref:Uncharacterized protein n=1 Tax=Melipona quadrifasciata TaxID=166423 RepID=A0A0M8ZR37_9HYME|nr:hypothetical protein WN51_04262 [Melipona quadrifasciata]